MDVLALLKPVESLLNRNLAASTPARALLGELEGRTLAVAVTTPFGGRLLYLRLRASAAGIVADRDESPADVSLSGTPLGLLGLAAARAGGRSTAAGAQISGDAEVASAFERLLRHARPEFEEELARILGELPAYYAARAARELLGWGRRAADSLARDLGEFLTEESGDLPPRAELEEFYANVDRVRDDVERLAARVAIVDARQATRRSAP